MSVIFVILGFVLICLILVHINLQKKKNELYKFIKKMYKTLMSRHKKIARIIDIIGDNDKTLELKALNENTISEIEKGILKPSQRIRSEILIEEKMKTLLEEIENKPISSELSEAIESYKKTQKKVDKNKSIYNKIIEEFMEACDIKPANWYASFEKIDLDYPRIIA